MKRLTWIGLLCCFLLFSLYSYAQPVAAAKTKAAKMNMGRSNTSNMRGAYQMIRQVVNDGTKDSLINNEQFKIFTDRHMNYVHPAQGDSLAVYGIGTYKVENGKVIENIFYTSSEGKVNEQYELSIKQLGDGYSQVINLPAQGENRSFVLTEDYKRADRSPATPLDSAWKQVRRMSIAKDGTTRTDESPTQFKVFQAGNFIWVNTSKDSATNKPVSVYGYGTFKTNGKNAIVEQNTSSTFKSILVGVPVTVQIKFTGKDSFQQTIEWPNGNKEIEVYQSL